MDQAILNALELFDNLVEEKKIKKKWFLYSQSYTTINVCTENKYYNELLFIIPNMMTNGEISQNWHYRRVIYYFFV